ncbi:MAG: ATP-binding protein [Candidatus Latescibacteria bacterium]|nr:ATP-binding protein [Candidatus Latescibacterota bacterium]
MDRPADRLNTELFDGLSSGDVDLLFELAELRSYPDSEPIILEGDRGQGIYIVASGEARVEKATIDQKQVMLATLREGDCFGELSLVDRQPRSATVRAIGETSAYGFAQDRLDAFFEAHPEIHRRILGNLTKITSQRLRWLDDALVQSVYDSVILLDRSCQVLLWKSITEEKRLLVGTVAPDKAVGHDLFEAVPFLGEGIRQNILHAMDSNEVTALQLDYEGPDGRTVYVEATIASHTEEGGTTGAVLGLVDVTETKTLEVQLIQAEKLAMAGQMSAEIGHELNNYLTVISGHTELLLCDPSLEDNERAQKSLQAVSDQIDKIQNYTSGLMDLGMLSSKTEDADLNTLVQKLIQFIQGQSRFRRIEFELDLDPELPRIQIDPGQIQQVLLNLYANAADAMGQGKVHTTTRFNTDTKKVVAEVEDNGPGMPEEVVNRIFDFGYTTKSTGHGFGLAVCRRIVENHSGNIEVESQPGKGTTFTLAFSA